jgi:transcriptional regulator with XRE-family HTH domain
MQIITKEEIGMYLRGRRKLKSMSNTELAKLVGISRTYISELENGHKIVSPTRLKLICDAIDADYQYCLNSFKIILTEIYNKSLLKRGYR